jgi:hypothetical protein
MQIFINISILAHIALDSELQGRFGVQGNTFKNTFGYLNQYFKTLPTLSPQLKKLSLAMDALVTREQEIETLYYKTIGSNVLDHLNPWMKRLPTIGWLKQATDEISKLLPSQWLNPLNAFVSKTTSEIEALEINQDLLLPGGWAGSPTGHAMIYQFQKDINGDLLFFIYNSGAGIGYHQKLSSTEKELYSSVKAYRLPAPVKSLELRNFIERLILPQLPINLKEFDAKKLYSKIEASLAFLDAQQIPEDLNTLQTTTGGQLSGTCSQRSIHQMLKANFASLADYQRFIFYFKLYALKDFINTHPSRSKAIIIFIEKAIINNLKIIQQDGVFNEEAEKQANIEQLRALQKKLHIESMKPTSWLNWPAPKSLLSSYAAPLLSNQLTRSITVFDKNEPSTSQLSSPQLISIRQNSLLSDLTLVINKCTENQHENTLFVIVQIEQTILQLPIPRSFDTKKPYYNAIPFYHQITTAHDFEMIGDALDQLHQLYITAFEKQLNAVTLPTQAVTLCSFLALRGYFDAMAEDVTTKPTVHVFFIQELELFFERFNAKTYFATEEPQFDMRFNDLISLSQSKRRPFERYVSQENSWIMLLDSEPELKIILEKMYTSAYYSDWRIFSYIRNDKLTGLYILFIQLDNQGKAKHGSVLAQKKFAPLMKKIQQHFLLLKACNTYLNPLKNHETKKPFYQKTAFEIFQNVDPYMTELVHITGFDFWGQLEPSDFYWKWHEKYIESKQNNICRTFPLPHDQKCITHHKYNMTESAAQQSLLWSLNYDTISKKILQKPSSNTIQLNIQARNSRDYFLRELFHLRASPSHQIKLTLDYFSKPESMMKLDDRNIQIYLTANLFDPELLQAALDDDPDFLRRFNTLVEQGLRHFVSSNGLLSQTSLFFLQLKTQMYRYLASRDCQLTHIEMLQHHHEDLCKHIDVHTDSAILASLHRYRFLIALRLHQLQCDKAQLWLDALFSYFYLKAKKNPYLIDDTASQFELQRAELSFKAWMREFAPKQFEATILPIIKNLGLDTGHLSLTDNYPRFIVHDKAGNTLYVVDVEKGRVYQQGYAISPIPLNIQHHPMIHRLNLDTESSCFLSEDETAILFNTPDVRIKKQSTGYAIQKKWALDPDKAHWYEIKPLSEEQQRLFGLTTVKIPRHTLPPVLTDATLELWVSEHDALLVRDNKPVYQIDPQGLAHQLDFHGHRNGYVLTHQPTSYTKLLAQFEDPNFTVINLNADQTEGRVDFVRYGISLDVTGDDLSLSGTDYRLIHPPSGVEEKIAVLHFSNGRQEQCIIAVQRFYVDEKDVQTPGEYYALHHDRSDYIAYKQNETTESTSKSTSNYHDSEQSIRYQIIDGKPKPHNAASGLYLCYINLATHEPEKAWAVLDDIRQRFTLQGTIEESMYLSWIIYALPTVLERKQSEAYTIETPEYAACQLKALALYTEHLKLGQDSTPSDKQSWSMTIQDLYKKYQRSERHLDEQYHLNDEERQTLLNYCENTQPALGALGYAKLRLKVKRLLQEYQRLTAIRDTNIKMPVHFAKRLVEIEHIIKKDLKVMKIKTNIDWVTLNLERFEKIRINEKTFSLPVCKVFYEWQNDVFRSRLVGDVDTALAVLHSAIDINDFFIHYPTYLHVARSSKDPTHRAKIKQFCTHYLIACHHDTSLNTTIYDLSYVLYSVLENPALFNKITTPVSSTKLYNMAISCPTPHISIAQAKDNVSETLQSTQDIWDELAVKNLASFPLPPLTAEFSEPLWQSLGLMGAKAYLNEEINCQRSMQTARGEEDAGQFKMACVKAQRQIAETILSSPIIRQRLTQRLKTLQRKQQNDSSQQWIHILDQANHAPPKQVQLFAKQRHLLTKNELLRFYLHEDLTLYMEKTGLSAEACMRLHRLIHQAMSLDVRQQQVVRALNALEKAHLLPKEANLHYIASELMRENIMYAQIDAAVMMLQYTENILIHQRQADVLRSLLSSDPYSVANVIEKVIMGGGKSKVIIPLMAQKKATGLNLVVVEVPRALLKTNYTDLNSTSQRLFGQKAHCFEFNRDSDCASSRLARIYDTFVEIMNDKAYLVTTGESMQSLQLKGLEFLLSNSDDVGDKSEWKKQVFWAEKIIHLLKERGDAVIDEVHQSLLFKKKLNYTLGLAQPISAEIIRHSIALYQFIDQLKSHTLWLNDLLDNVASPLSEIMQGFLREDLVAFFNNERMPASIKLAPAEIKDTLAFYKAQLRFLPRTQARHYKEHYGPSQQQDTALKRALAIPYLASNKPNERSRFGNPLETINYTIQALLHEGLSIELLEQLVAQWQETAHQELFATTSTYNHFAETPTAIRANAILEGTGLTLQAIDLSSTEGKAKLGQLFDVLKENRSFLFSALQQSILPQVTVEPHTLHSDVYNHVDLYRSAQGLTGTPWNHTTYHQRLSYNPAQSLGTDGYIQAILKDKSTLIRPLSFTTIDDFLDKLLPTNQRARALIDISATFAGISNADVACKLAQSAPEGIRYILYFNESDVLCAMDTRTQRSTILGSSDPHEIDEKLGCSVDKRFTYYDQSHTVGTDLKQDSTAHAFVLADKRTHLQSFLQGCLRMRELEHQQTLSIIIPEEIPTSLDQFIALITKNEHDQLQEDNFFAAKAKMINLIREDFLKRLARIDDDQIEKKQTMAQAFKSYFVEINLNTLFEQYGLIEAEQSTHDLLKRHQARLIHEWKHFLTEATIEPTTTEENELTQSLTRLVEQSFPLCKSTVLSSSTSSPDINIEVEYQKETLKEVEKEWLNENVQSGLTRTYPHQWGAPPYWPYFIALGRAETMQPLNQATQLTPIFTNNILVDDNYARVYEQQATMLCSYLKPVEAILFRQQGDSLSACIVDVDDLNELHDETNKLNSENEPKVWISTTQHTLLSGSFPKDIFQNQEYQSIIEQIRFFNGECHNLSTQKTPLVWLNHHSSEKLAFFQEYLMPYRQTAASSFEDLQNNLSLGLRHQASKGVTPPSREKKTLTFFNKKQALSLDPKNNDSNPSSELQL